MANVVLWIYIVLLVAGGSIGFLKAGSKISLITSAAFGLVLTLFALGWLRPAFVADMLLVVLVCVFAARFAKGKKFMPAGLMAVLTLVALLLRLVL